MNNYDLIVKANNVFINHKTIYKLGAFMNQSINGALLCDCLGLIEGLMWGYPEAGNYKSNGVPDLNANGLWNAADVKGSISTIPEVPGVLVYNSGSPGHVGIYLGQGNVLECTAHVFLSGEGNGIVISQFADKKEKNYRSWQGWLKYPYIEYVQKEGAKMASFFIPGYQKLSWSGKVVHVYGQKNDLEIGLMSTPNYRQLQLIKDIDNNETHYCKVNCSYFDMSGADKGQVFGREQGFTEDNRPDQKEWIDVVITKDNKVIAGDLASWEYSGDQVKAGFSPLAVILKDGNEVEMVSSAVSSSVLTSSTQRTLLMQDADGLFYFAVSSDGLTVKQCRSFAKAYGMMFCAVLDGGGSSQMRADGKSIRETGRALPNVLTFYKKTEVKPVEPETPPVEPEKENTMPFNFRITKGTFSGGKKYPTRATATSKYDTKYSLNVGDEFWIDKMVGEGNYWIGRMVNGDQAGRWIQLDPTCMEAA